jgi:hypothetical protein
MATPPRREYELTVRQEPKQARMCGVGGKHNLQFHHLGNITLLIQPTVAQSTLLQSSSCASLIPARADRLPVHLQQARIMRRMGEVCFSLSLHFVAGRNIFCERGLPLPVSLSIRKVQRMPFAYETGLRTNIN